MDSIDQLLAVKIRLTTIKGYAQLIEREVERDEAHSERLNRRIHQLNREIIQLVKVVASIEVLMADRERPGTIPQYLDHDGEQPIGY